MVGGINVRLNWRSTLILVAASFFTVHYIRAKKKPRLPPGPRGIPFVGNVFVVLTEKRWLKFAELGDVWGTPQSPLSYPVARQISE
jgi:hypothetical protein